MKYIPLFLLFIIGLVVFAQDMLFTPKKKRSEVKEDNKIVIRKNAKKQPTYVDFVGKKTGKVHQTIDLAKANPFMHLPFPTYLQWEKTRYRKYNLSRVPYEIIVKKLLPNIEDALTRRCQPKYATSYYRIMTRENAVLLLPTLSMSGQYDGTVACNTHIYKYNAKGELIFTQKNINDGMTSGALTEDGRYFAYKHVRMGGLRGDCTVGSRHPDGIKIIDTHTGELVLTEQELPNKTISSPKNIGNKIRLGYKLKDSTRAVEYHFLDFKKNIRYKKKYSYKEYWHVKDITTDGMVFYDMADTSKTKVYLFEKDFEQTPIK